MSRLALCVLSMVAALVGAAVPVAGADTLITAELVSNVKTVRAGRAFTAGVWLHIRPGWHVYWTNPGDAGLATSVKFAVPEGWSVGPVNFPVPVTFESPGDIVGYGYKDEVLLTAEVTPSGELSADGTPPVIRADVSWLCCEKVCVPGKAKLELSLPADDRSTTANDSLFDTWARRMPVPASESKDLHRLYFHGSLGEGWVSAEMDFWNAMPSAVEFYPSAVAGLEVTDLTVQRHAGRYEVKCKVRPLQGLGGPATSLPVLVALHYGERRGVTFNIPLRPTP